MRIVLLHIFIWALCLTFGQEDTIRFIQFENLKKTKPVFVEKIIKSKVGDTFDKNMIETEIERLSRLPGFINVSHSINDDTLSYNFNEAFTIIPSASIWTQGDFISFGLGLEEFNFIGRGAHLGAFYQFNGKHSYSMFIRYPYLIKRFGLSSTFSSFTSDEPVFINNERLIYEYNNNSFEISASYEINLNHLVEFGGVIFRERYKHLTSEINPGAPASLDIRKYLTRINYQYNNTKFFYFYVSGWRIFNSYQLVTTPNEIPFHSFETYSAYFKRIKEKGNFCVRAGLGIASNEESPFPPFVLDNQRNVRGVGDRVARGSGFGVINVEYRHTLLEKKWFALQGVGFIDASTWRNSGNSLADFVMSENIPSTAGIGVRAILTKIHGAVLRIDYGVSITRKRSHGIVIGVGQYF